MASRGMVVVVVAAALFGCARDNPLFNDDGTDGADGTTTRTTSASSPTGSQTSASSTEPTSDASSSDPGTSESVSETQSVVTSDSFGTTFGTTGSGTHATSASETETCTSVLHPATLDADAFLVARERCDDCADANYGATTQYDLFESGSGVAYYVAKFADLPAGGQVIAATLAITVELQINLDASLEVYAFWPGCDWPEGTGQGPLSVADGITYNACDPVAGVEYTKGSVPASIGELVAPAVSIDDGPGPVELEIDLDVDAVQDWLDGGGDNLLFSASVEPGVLQAIAREAKVSGGLQLEITTCG